MANATKWNRAEKSITERMANAVKWNRAGKKRHGANGQCGENGGGLVRRNGFVRTRGAFMLY